MTDPCRRIARVLMALAALLVIIGILATPVQSDQPVVPPPAAVMMAVHPPVQTSQEGAVVAKHVEPTPTPIPRAAAPARGIAAPQVNGSHEEWMREAGIAESDFQYVEFIVQHEGNWNPCVINGGAVDCSYAVNGGSRAYGVCQAKPGNKMASAGADWATNVVTQLRWCAAYSARYGGWQGSYRAWLRQKWW
jgi:hypothetical protein